MALPRDHVCGQVPPMIAPGTRCAVLGAGGFIGTNLCLALVRMGAQVTAIGRRPSSWPEPLRAVLWHEADFGDAAAMAAAVLEQEVVFHLLGGSVPFQSNDDPVGDIQSSLIPSVRLIESCAANTNTRIVFLSSGGTVYGPSEQVPLTENSATNPITAYGINKLAVEKYLGLFRHLHGLDSIVLRLTNPYGPYQHRRRAQGIIGTVLSKALAGDQIEIWGDGSIVRDYVFIDDVVSAMLASATYQGSQRLLNIGSGQGRSVRDVVEDVCALTGTPTSRVVYRPNHPTDVPYNVLDCTLARNEMGWEATTDWLSGLRATARWLQEPHH